MKKKLLASVFLFLGILNVQADPGEKGCFSLINTSWSGTVVLADNTTQQLNVKIQKIIPSGYPPVGLYYVTGTVNDMPIDSRLSICQTKYPTNEITTLVLPPADPSKDKFFIFSPQFYNNIQPTEIIPHGSLDWKKILSGSISKQ